MKHKKIKRFRKKSQMEAFGLALIIILIVIGFTIFVKFKVKSDADRPQYKNEFVKDQTPSKFVYSISELHVKECTDFRNRQTISDLLKDCATLKTITCGGKDSCYIVNETISKIANETFAKKNIPFFIKTKGLARNNGVSELNITNGDCSKGNGVVGESKIPLYPRPGEVHLFMAFCN